jgi:hypothetical protein
MVSRWVSAAVFSGVVGTTALKSERLSPVLERAREAAAPTLSSEERREKIAASKRGVPLRFESRFERW